MYLTSCLSSTLSFNTLDFNSMIQFYKPKWNLSNMTLFGIRLPNPIALTRWLFLKVQNKAEVCQYDTPLKMKERSMRFKMKYSFQLIQKLFGLIILVSSSPLWSADSDDIISSGFATPINKVSFTLNRYQIPEPKLVEKEITYDSETDYEGNSGEFRTRSDNLKSLANELTEPASYFSEPEGNSFTKADEILHLPFKKRAFLNENGLKTKERKRGRLSCFSGDNLPRNITGSGHSMVFSSFFDGEEKGSIPGHGGKVLASDKQHMIFDFVDQLHIPNTVQAGNDISTSLSHNQRLYQKKNLVLIKKTLLFEIESDSRGSEKDEISSVHSACVTMPDNNRVVHSPGIDSKECPSADKVELPKREKNTEFKSPENFRKLFENFPLYEEGFKKTSQKIINKKRPAKPE